MHALRRSGRTPSGRWLLCMEHPRPNRSRRSSHRIILFDDTSALLSWRLSWRYLMISAVPSGACTRCKCATRFKSSSVFSESVRNAAKAENPTATCVFCRREGTATQVDHAIPRSRGGNATLDNAQMACPHCNASKGAGDFPKNPPPGYTGPWPPPPL
jgi:5-methylcytosine-specific restriction endonuclease McrA